MLVALNERERERERVCVCEFSSIKVWTPTYFCHGFSVTIISCHMFYVLLLYFICWQKCVVLQQYLN